jgi:SAM-dependent methyltransferase/uncharacterized protein YbaR (Trm112 family)
MKPYALQHYVCPFSGQPLELIAIKSRTISLDAEQRALARRLGIDPEQASTAIEEGILFSDKGGYWFPIINFVPVLLDFPVPLHADFAQRHGAAYDVLKRLSMPSGVPRPGEYYVQRSFTREWAIMDLDTISFGYSPEQRDFFTYLELDWPPGLLERENLRILEVGCGSGFESASLFRVTKGAIFGFDLNLALLQKGHLLADEPFICNAVCSLFRLPLREMSYDIVYSSGVIHHTFSTVEALKQILRFKKADGLLYVWVYASEDYGRNLKARFVWVLEDIFRPRIARLPDFWQDIVVRLLARRHYKQYKVAGGFNRRQWRRKDSEHSIRDRWTCLYAHRQSFNDMMRLFSELGMEYRLIDPKKYEEFMKVPLIGIGIRGIHPSESVAAAQIGALAKGIEDWTPTGALRHSSKTAKGAALLLVLVADRVGREALSTAKVIGNRPLVAELGRVIAAKRNITNGAAAGRAAQLLPRISDGILELCASEETADAVCKIPQMAEVVRALSERQIRNLTLVVEPWLASRSFLLGARRYELPNLLAWLEQRPERIERLLPAASRQSSPQAARAST